MFSAAGARNVQSKVRKVSAHKSLPHRDSSKKQSVDKEHGLHCSPSEGSSRHLKKMDSNGSGSSDNENKNGVNTPHAKHKGKVGVDRMKQNGQSGINVVRQQSMNILQHRLNIGMTTNNKAIKNKPLPTRSLFQHKRRTWFGCLRKKSKAKKEVDWRNTRLPSNHSSVSSKTKKKKKVKKSGSRKGEHQGNRQKLERSSSTVSTDFNSKGKIPSSLRSNLQDRPISRSRSAPTKVTFAEDNNDWHHYSATDNDEVESDDDEVESDDNEENDYQYQHCVVVEDDDEIVIYYE